MRHIHTGVLNLNAVIHTFIKHHMRIAKIEQVMITTTNPFVNKSTD